MHIFVIVLGKIPKPSIQRRPPVMETMRWLSVHLVNYHQLNSRHPCPLINMLCRDYRNIVMQQVPMRAATP